MAIAELIGELQSASRPDRDLDTKIAFIVRFKSQNPNASEIPHFTSSLDAAVALAKKIAPASVVGTEWLPDGSGTARLDDDKASFGSNDALAICILALRRKVADDKFHASILKRSASNYRILFKKGAAGSKSLLVIMSPYQGFMMARRDFGTHTLYVYEATNSYYSFQTDLLTADIKDYAEQLGVNEIIFMGSSKAGYGALMAGRLFHSDTDMFVTTVAFSPVTRVFPLEKNLPFKTYPAYLALLDQKPFVRASAERLGLLPRSPAYHGYRERIIYGEYCDYDINEICYLAERTENPERFMSVASIPASTHNVVSLLAADKTDIETFVDSCLTSAKRDLELPWLEQDSEQFKREANAIFDAIKHISIEDVIGVSP